jgi:hypothetical protein
MKKSFFLIGFILFCKFSFSQWQQKEFVIGTFADPRITYENNFIKDSLSYVKAKNAYINLLTGPQFYMGARDFSMMDRTLKLAEKFDMHLIVIDSRFKIADSSFNEDTALKIISHFKSLNSKAFEGYYIYGEAAQKHIKQITQWANFFKKKDPEHLVYYYLLPRYAFKSANEYESYVNAFSSNKATDVLAYDFYPFSKNGKIVNSYFYNLDLISKKAGNKPFWYYVLANSTPYYNDPTEYELNFSAFCPIAYGGKGIIYFTYETIPEKYNLKFGDALIDKNGNPTKKYAVVKKINEYISKVIGPVIMNSTRVATFHNTARSDDETLNKSQVVDSNFLKISNPNILVGVFKSKINSSRYLLLVNKRNDTLPDLKISIRGNLAQSVKIYPRANELNGSLSPKPVPAKFNSGKTSFIINHLLPGEAILLQY